MRQVLTLLALASLATGLARQAAPAPLPLPAGYSAPGGYGDSIYPLLGDSGLDVTHYDLTLSAAPGVDAIAGRAVLSVTARRPLGQINLDFAGPRVLGVKVDGLAARHAQVGEKLLVLPARPIAAGAAFTVTVAYSGTPALHLDTSDPGFSGTGGLRLGWITQAGGSYVLSEPDGSHTYFPCNDIAADGATYSLHLDVPVGVTAIASGVQTKQRTQGKRVYTDFQLDQPIPTYALTVHVGRLQIVNQTSPKGTNKQGVSLRNAFPTGLPADVRASFDQTPAMLDLLSAWFGAYPYPVYGVAVSEDPQIPALETATLSTFPARNVGSKTALHELAHQWFGDSLRLGDWSDVWLNEGFATYAELLWAQSQGEDAQALVDRWYDMLSNAPVRGLIATSAAQLFDTSSYQRGALTLHALRQAVGDPAFRSILSTYVARYTGRSVRTADLLAVIGEIGGEIGLDAVRPWIDGPGIPPSP